MNTINPNSEIQQQFTLRDEHANMLIIRSAEMQEVALAAYDVNMFWRYNAITLRLIYYRSNLLYRYGNS